jgi:hypothetical protein
LAWAEAPSSPSAGGLSSHHLHVGDRLVFRFRLGPLEALVRVFDANGGRRIYPLPAAME